MAAAAADYDAKTTGDKKDGSSSGNIVLPWQPCYGKEELNALKGAMLGVMGQFWTKAKEMGFSVPNDEYNPTDTGEYYLLNDSHLIGLVKLFKPDNLVGYYASVRASRKGIFLNDPKGTDGVEPILPAAFFKLHGFWVDEWPRLHFVENNEYVVNFGETKKMLETSIPQGWVPCEVKLLKEAMEAVKDEFWKMAKELGFDPKDKEYYPTDTGIFVQFIGAQEVIGLVQLSKPGTIGGYYASVRAGRAVALAKGNGPWGFEGCIISIFPWLQFVQDKMFATHVTEKDINTDAIKNTDNKMVIGMNGFSATSYTDTGVVQSLVGSDKVKDIIKKKAGVSWDLPAFQVASATTTLTFSLLYTNYFAKIWTGVSPMTHFPSYIYVSFSYSGLMEPPSLFVNEAWQSPL